MRISVPQDRKGKKRSPQTDEWRNKMWSIHIMEYYSAIKRTEALILATTSMNPKNIILSERSEPEMATHYVIPSK